MKTRAIVTSTLASVGVLVVGWQVGAAALTEAEQATSVSASAGSSSGSTSSGTTSTSSDSTTEVAPSTTEVAPVTTVVDGTYTGAAASTKWGDVQVAVTITGGAIAEVTALQLTDADGKSIQLSNRAAPILREEVIAAQSTDVANVSGATYTTQAYLTSVQSALDQAGL